MKFFKKSIVWRLLLYLAGFNVLIVGASIFLFIFQKKEIPLGIFSAVIILLVVFFVFLAWYDFARPLREILVQIRALLTGRQYKKLFTKRLDEIGVIAHFFNEVTKNMEKVSHQLKEGKRMLSELEIASNLQKEILPLQAPKVPGLEIVAKTRPAVELGGDNFDFITVKDKTYIYIGDVTGHGVPSAIVMTMVHTLIHTFTELFDNAYEIVVQTNRRLKTHIKSTMFMTMVMLQWNHSEQKMTYVGAGHEHILIYRAGTATCEARLSGGIALGMVADNSKIIKAVDLPLEKGDVIILYSDGIIEARNMAGEMFGLERLKKAVEFYATQYGPEGIIFHIARDFSHFVQNHIQEDDITLMAIRYSGAQAETTASLDQSTQWSYSEEK